MDRPPESLVVGELVVRRYVVADAPALHDAITASVEHLRPWMPWIGFEPLEVADRERLIADVFDTGWAESADFVYGVFLGDEVVGGTGLHRRIGEGGLEIGYWIRVGHTRRGYATGIARALTEAAFGIDGVDRVEIHHDKANVASGRVPAKLGFTLVAERPDTIDAPSEIGISCEWRLERRLAPDESG